MGHWKSSKLTTTTLASLFAARGATVEVDFFHCLDIRIFGQVQFGHSSQSFAILGKKELVTLLFLVAVHSDGQGVIIRKVTGTERADRDLHASRNIVSNPYLPLDFLGQIGEGTGAN